MLQKKIVMAVLGNIANDNRVYKEALYFSKRGFNVVIITTNPEKKNEKINWGQNINIIDLDMQKNIPSKLYYLIVMWKIFKIAFKEKADYYIAHDLDTLPPLFYASYLHMKKLIYDSHEIFTEQIHLKGRFFTKLIWSFLEYNYIKHCDYVFTVNESCAERLKGKYGIKDPLVIKNLPLFYLAERKNIIRAKYKIPPYMKICVYLGNLNYKEISLTLDIALQLRNAYFIFIGDGKYRSYLEGIIVSKKLTNKVTFAGEISQHEVKDYLQSADLGFVTFYANAESLYYSLPNKIFDYTMAGLPIIACDYPEIRKFIDKNNNGILIDANNLEQSINKIQNVIDDDKYRETLRNNSLLAAKNINWFQEIEKVNDIIK